MTTAVYAYAYTNIDEHGSKFFGSGGLSTYNCTGCEGGKSKRVLATNSTGNWTDSGQWSVSSPPAYEFGRMDWKVFNPNPGGLRSAIRLGVYQSGNCGPGVECFEIVDDQSTGAGADAYLGYLSSGSSASFVLARNWCTSGYVCQRYICYDTARYTQP